MVLRYKNGGGRANYVNRHRVRATVRPIDPMVGETVLVFCGGPVAGRIPEADLMAKFARRTLGYRGPAKLDRTGLSTWDNIRNAIPLVETADTIKIVSDSMHAHLPADHGLEAPPQRPPAAEEPLVSA